MDKLRLEYEIKRKGMTIDDFCAEIDISRSAYYRKVKGLTEFTQGEIQRSVEVLGLESPVGIFFPTKVS